MRVRTFMTKLSANIPCSKTSRVRRCNERQTIKITSAGVILLFLHSLSHKAVQGYPYFEWLRRHNRKPALCFVQGYASWWLHKPPTPRSEKPYLDKDKLALKLWETRHRYFSVTMQHGSRWWSQLGFAEFEWRDFGFCQRGRGSRSGWTSGCRIK